MKLTLILLIILSNSFFSSQEVIQLENSTHLTCISDNPNSVMSVIPPIVHKAKNTEILLSDDSFWDDWDLKNSTEVVAPVVTDKRWEDFATIFTSSIHYDSVKSLSFSVYNIDVNVTTDPKRSKANFGFPPVIWSHQNIHSPDQKSSIKIDANAPKDVYWKIHDYRLRWAERSSTKPTTVPISNETCLMVYIYLCSHCKLELDAAGHKYSFHGVDEELIWYWQNKKIELDSASNITFIRSTFNESVEEGQWGVDIRKCPLTKSNKTIFTVDLQDDVEKEMSFRVCDRTDSNDTNYIFGCEPGILGGQCDVNCEEIFDSEAKYCEKRKICSVYNNCECAWGSQGELCDQDCTEETWGLSCRKSCKNCKTCNAMTGDCNNNSELVYSSFQMLSVLVLLLVQL